MKPNTPNKILIVDDTLSIIDLVKDMLLSRGYQVYIATSGEKALQIAENILPDLILLDILMPGIDGYQTCFQLKSNKTFSNTPIIIMSALNEPFDKVKAFHVGASDYISKPVETEELFARINTHLHLYSVQKQLLEANNQLEKRVLERTLELQIAKEKAEESDRLKSAFLANISHEIRTPLNGILGFSELIAVPDLTDDKRAEYVRTIAECGDKLLKTVNDILDLSKIQAHIHKINISLVNILAVLNELLEEFTALAHEKNLKLSTDIEHLKEEILLYTDPAKLKQILGILIENALKFTESGSVVIGCLQSESNEVIFTITDTGPGIPEELLNKVFENFRQAEEDFSRSYGGTGVGLAICKGLVELLGGSVTVESVVGKGTCFYVKIRNLEEKINTTIAEEKIETNIDGQKFTILVAEDEEANFLFINEVFFNLDNVSIIRAENGIEAIDHVKNNMNVDLVLMDIKMPEMDGIQAMVEIKKMKPHLPVVALTAYASEDDRMRFLHAGFDNYFSKPVRASDLFDFVNTYIK